MFRESFPRPHNVEGAEPACLSTQQVSGCSAPEFLGCVDWFTPEVGLEKSISVSLFATPISMHHISLGNHSNLTNVYFISYFFLYKYAFFLFVYM